MGDPALPFFDAAAFLSAWEEVAEPGEVSIGGRVIRGLRVTGTKDEGLPAGSQIKFTVTPPSPSRTPRSPASSRAAVRARSGRR